MSTGRKYGRNIGERGGGVAYDPRIRAMHSTMELRDQLREDEWKRQDMQDAYLEARDELKSLDPAGWGDWYDREVPEWMGWLNCGQALEVMRKRIDELKLARMASGDEKSPTFVEEKQVML
jgi:hypothetical protein